MVTQGKGRAHTHLWAWGSPEPISALRTKDRRIRASVSGLQSPQDPSHLLFVQRGQEGQGHPWVLEDLPVQALPVAETGLLGEQLPGH